MGSHANIALYTSDAQNALDRRRYLDLFPFELEPGSRRLLDRVRPVKLNFLNHWPNTSTALNEAT